MRYRNHALSFATDNFLEDFEKFRFSDFTVWVFVDSWNELVNFGLGDLPILSHMLEGVIDKKSDFIDFKSSTLVFVVGIEYSIDCVSKVVVWVAHFLKLW